MERRFEVRYNQDRNGRRRRQVRGPFTRQQFQNYHGANAEREWNRATINHPNGTVRDITEDGTDGQGTQYRLEDFQNEYGDADGAAMWDASPDGSPAPPRGPPGRSRRGGGRTIKKRRNKKKKTQKLNKKKARKTKRNKRKKSRNK